MNNEKIGRFISEIRKSRQMTQKELADKLNVTDKAVSKWERGLSYPDISLLLPLSDTLGITINELLSGEKIEDTENKTSADITVENVLEYANKAVKNKTKSAWKKAILIAAGVFVFIMGTTLVAYPAVARRWNARIQQGIVTYFSTEAAQMPQYIIEDQFRRAEEYNAILRELSPLATFEIGHLASMPEDYTQILNVRGVMARITIPTIDVDMPVFHGTDSLVLYRGAGHLEGTSFPTGGYGNHTAIVALSGLVNARMFSDLKELDIGDIFFISVLDRRLAYEVFEIRTILPHEIEYLRIIPGEDLVTLITCAPHRVNTHRLLVHGRRIPYEPDNEYMRLSGIFH